MGRAFEFRKERKFKRWAGMAKTFTRIGREIALAVKAGGPEPEYNPRLRLAIQNAKTANMPKTNVENAIKKASSKDAENFQEVVYEGQGPHKIAFIIETATDNPTRTVAMVRMHLSRNSAEMVESGTHNFIFNRKGQFKFLIGTYDIGDLELSLIDYGLEAIFVEENEVTVLVPFTEFGAMQKGLEELNIEVSQAEIIRLPSISKQLHEEQVEDVIKLIDKLEEEDDVINVFHNMDMDSE